MRATYKILVSTALAGIGIYIGRYLVPPEERFKPVQKKGIEMVVDRETGEDYIHSALPNVVRYIGQQDPVELEEALKENIPESKVLSNSNLLEEYRQRLKEFENQYKTMPQYLDGTKHGLRSIVKCLGEAGNKARPEGSWIDNLLKIQEKGLKAFGGKDGGQYKGNFCLKEGLYRRMIAVRDLAVQGLDHQKQKYGSSGSNTTESLNRVYLANSIETLKQALKIKPLLLRLEALEADTKTPEDQSNFQSNLYVIVSQVNDIEKGVLKLFGAEDSNAANRQSEAVQKRAGAAGALTNSSLKSGNGIKPSWWKKNIDKPITETCARIFGQPRYQEGREALEKFYLETRAKDTNNCADQTLLHK